MKNCKVCGGEVRIRTHKVTYNRKGGVYSYIEHVNADGCEAHKGYDAVTMKSDKIKNYELLIERWESDNEK